MLSERILCAIGSSIVDSVTHKMGLTSHQHYRCCMFVVHRGSIRVVGLQANTAYDTLDPLWAACRVCHWKVAYMICDRPGKD